MKYFTQAFGAKQPHPAALETIQPNFPPDPKKGELKKADQLNKELSTQRSEEVKASEPEGTAHWSDYSAE